MNPRTKFFRGLALIGALGVGLAACEDTIVNVEPTPSISASPSTISLTVGQSQAIVASVTGLTGGINYESSAPAVATVDANGLVTGVSAGSATIRVISQADPNVKTGVGVVVTSAALPPSTESEVTIQQLTSFATNLPVDPTNVSGQVDVTMSVSRGDADRLVVLLNGQEVGTCSQSFGNAAAAAELTAPNLQLAPNQSSVVCSINTAQFDPATGAVTYLNGSYDLVVELRKGTQVLDRARVDNLQFNNVDTFVTTATNSGNTATSTSGLVWKEGNVQVTALPVMYSGKTVSQVVLSLAPQGGGAFSSKTVTAAPFTATFQKSQAPGAPLNGVANISSPIVAFVSASVAGGTTGPNTSSAAPETAPNFMRLDNVAPAGGTFVLTQQNLVPTPLVPVVLCCSNNWVGANYSFANGKTGQSDAGGVGVGAVTFHVGTATLPDTAIAKLPAVTKGSDLPETAVNTGLRAVAVVNDLLGNRTLVPLDVNAVNPQNVGATPGEMGATLGVDKTAPTAQFANTSVAANSIFNIVSAPGAADDFVVAFSDTATAGAAPSGFTGTPVLTTLDRWAPTLTAAQRCVIGVMNQAATVCQATATTGTVALAGLADGYYTINARVVDQAGNESAALNRLSLIDQVGPTGGNLVVPSTLVGGQNATFSADVTDNVNLHQANLWLGFNAVVDPIPFSTPEILNAQWPTTLLPSATASRTIAFVRALELTDGANAPVGTLNPAVGALFRAFDAAFNENIVASGPLNPVGTPVSFTTRGVASFAVTAPNAAQNICAAAGAAACAGTPVVPGTRALTAIATGASGTFDNPFQTVNFYRLDANGIVRLVASVNSASVTDNGVTRTWTWNATFDASGLPAQANAPIFAVGVNASGDALRSADNTNISIVR